MIRKLRIKFIVVILLVVVVIISAMGAIINYSVSSGTYTQYDRALDDFYEYISVDSDLFGEDNSTNDRSNDSNLFYVRKSADGDYYPVDIESVIGLESEYVHDLADKAMTNGKKHGFADIYRYGVYSDDIGNQVAIFQNVRYNIDFLNELQDITIAVSVAIFLIAAMISFPASEYIAEIIVEQLESHKEFISNASHDLKTPVAVISANMDVLSMTMGDNQWVQSTKKQAKILKKLINNIIITSKLNEKGFSTPFEDFDISAAAHDVTELFTEMAKQKNLSFASDIETNVYCHGSEFYIRQLMTILCENAVNYTTENGRIELALREHKGYIYINITNNRDPEEKIETEKIFDRFYRGDSSRSTDKYGNGLGLSMAKSIAEMHSGSISAYCKTNDTITFSVILKG